MNLTTMLTTTMLMAVLLLSPSAAASSTSDDYVVAGSISIFGATAGVPLCETGCDVDRDGDDDGRAQQGPYVIPGGTSILVVSAHDLVWGKDVAMAVCWLNPNGDDVCDDDDFVSSASCGDQFFFAPFRSTEIVVQFYSALVEGDLSACGATAGSVTIDPI